MYWLQVVPLTELPSQSRDHLTSHTRRTVLWWGTYWRQRWWTRNDGIRDETHTDDNAGEKRNDGIRDETHTEDNAGETRNDGIRDETHTEDNAGETRNDGISDVNELWA